MKELVQKHIAELTPYLSARMITEGNGLFMDANEGQNLIDFHGIDLATYPVQQKRNLTNYFSQIYAVEENQLLMDRGSDTLIKLLLQAYCAPGIDRIGQFPPTYGVYRVFANSLNIAVTPYLVKSDFSVDMEYFESNYKGEEKLIFLCSPNNPTGTPLPEADLRKILNKVNKRSIVIVDEAYVEFSEQESMSRLLGEYSELVILRTLSKAYGLAGLRVGFALANSEIIETLRKVQMPYPFDTLTYLALEMAIDQNIVVLAKNQVEKVRMLRNDLDSFLRNCSFVKEIYPSEANFILCRVENQDAIYQHLKSRGIIVRKFDSSPIEGSLRFSLKNQSDLMALKKGLETYK